MKRKNVVGGVGLIALGAIAAVAATHVQVHWGPTASAAPVVAAEVKPALPPPSPQAVNDARAFSHTMAQIAAQLGPSVVRISVVKGAPKHVGQAHHRFQGENPFEGTPFERFFGEPDEGGPAPKQKGLGSGVVIDKRGYILTNNHVVEDADDVKVTFLDGKTVPGKIVGTDPNSDLAVVKVSGVDVTPARLGDSDKIQVGEFVMAIGNPLGFDHTVTVGVLSAKGRAGLTGTRSFEDFLQTDASINPGNSGGPLVNLDGEVIGINTMIAGVGTGIGFAVPSSMAKPIVQQLIDTGHVRRPYVGIRMQLMTPELQKALGQNAPAKGAFVGDVDKGTPADQAGVKPRDVITAVNGQPVSDSRDVQKDVLQAKIGQKVDLTLWRDGKTVHVYPVTKELPGDEKLASRSGESSGDSEQTMRGNLGLSLTSVTPAIAQELGIEQHAKGAVVTGVRDGSPAQEAGLQRGDVIIEVDRKPIGGADDAVSALTSKKAPVHLVRVRRQNEAVYLTLPAA